MVYNIYLDLDNVLIYSCINQLRTDNREYSFICNSVHYWLYKRNNISSVIDFCRSIVGYERVFILTESVRDYATKINSILQFGFDPQTNIIAREDISDALFRSSRYSLHKTGHSNNILIDDLYEKYLKRKFSIGSITSIKNFLKVKPFLGWESDENNQEFINTVTKFVLSRNENNLDM